jgi:hypothetical protein
MLMSKSRKKKAPKRVLVLRDLERANNGRFADAPAGRWRRPRIGSAASHYY